MDMQRDWMLVILAVIAIGVALLVSYNPPKENAQAIWLMMGMLVKGAIGALFDALKAPPGGAVASKPAPDSGFAGIRLLALVAVASLALVALGGCGAVNTYTGAALTAAESDYAGARRNVQAADDLKLMAWADAACAMPLGALQRNATNNPGVVVGVLTACPIPNVGVVNIKDGALSVSINPTPTPTTPYTPAPPAGK